MRNSKRDQIISDTGNMVAFESTLIHLFTKYHNKALKTGCFSLEFKKRNLLLEPH